MISDSTNFICECSATAAICGAEESLAATNWQLTEQTTAKTKANFTRAYPALYQLIKKLRLPHQV
jgi:hypothetical protein